MKFQERTKKLYFPVFSHYTVYIVVTNNIVQSREKLNIKIGEKYAGGGDPAGMHCTDHGGRSWILIEPNSSPGIVAHECWHCVNTILNWIGADLDNEVVAYHLGYLVGEVTYFKGNR